MKRNAYLIVPLLFCSLFGASLALPSETEEADGKNAEVRLPWDEFEKMLRLGTDDIELELEEFIALLRQTNAKAFPPFIVKGARIALKRADFKRLLDSMKPPVADEALGDYLMTRASYRATVEQDTTLVEAEFNIEVLKTGDDPKYAVIPLLPREVALRDVRLDGMPALVTSLKGHHAVAISESGSHTVRISFNVGTDLKHGPQSISFPVPETPITLLSMEIPIPSIKPEISSARAIKTIEEEEETRVKAILSPTRRIEVTWSRVISEEEKGPAKIYVDLHQLLSIEDDALRVQATAHFQILQNTVSDLSLRVPTGYQILNVTGASVGDWREKSGKTGNLLEISLKTAQQGDVTILVHAEKILPDQTAMAEFNGFEVLGAVREKGILAVEVRSSAEAKVPESEGLDRVSFPELPAALVSRSEKPLIFAFKYLRHPYRMVLDILKHEELPIVSTVIDNASAMTLFTKDGKRVYRVTYSIRNTWKQFMEIALPEKIQLWSVFVVDKPVKPSRNAEGKILIPLNRSQQGKDGLSSFTVEIICYQKEEPFGWFGRKGDFFFVPDVMISRTIWSVYLPLNHRFVHFGGTMEKEKIASGVRPLLGLNKRVIDYRHLKKQAPPASQPIEGRDRSDMARSLMRMKKELSSDFQGNVPLAEEEVAQQLANEMYFGERVQEVQSEGVGLEAGIMPIRIEIPANGQLYRFAQQIISDEQPDINFIYVDNRLVRALEFVVFLLFLFLLYRKREGLEKGWRVTSNWVVARKGMFSKPVSPGWLVSILFILFVCSLSLYSRFLSAVLLALLVLASVRFLVHLRREGKHRKEMSSVSQTDQTE
jgi:hypothetical protein